MIRRIKWLCLVIGFVAMATSLSAQDLQSQRGESQDLGEILGYRVDRGGLVINPFPQQFVPMTTDGVDISRGVKLVGEAREYAEELGFLAESRRGAKLTISFYADNEEMCEVFATMPGSYILEISNNAIEISAYDDAGAFYAIQTLRQIVDSPISADGIIPPMSINDWPDLQYRGVVEGFYGEPWSHEVRLSLIDFYGRFKMNYYIYGPKDDPYHSSPNWRLPYPEQEAAEIRELVEACRRNRVNFVWAIHPGQDIQWTEEDYNNLLNKFEAMYDLGVRAFAIHFDDISGIGANPMNQTELTNRLNAEFVAAKGDVASLIVCPTDYTRLWANPTERGSLVWYGNNLDPSVDVFWTGDAVCSNMTESTMEWVGSRIQRPALFWWNFPVTDYARHIIMQGPVYGLATTMDATKTRGIVSNPMEHGEASKLALYSTADYAWRPSKYNPIDSWERAIECVAPEVSEAYRLFAIHSCDTETGYRRLESWETETFTFAEYDGSEADVELCNALVAELEAIVALPEAMEAMQNKALLEELRPWIVELSKLGTRCLKAIECMNLYHAGNYAEFWSLYVDNLMTEEDTAMYDAHRIGTMKLLPFYERMMDDMAAAYYEQLTGQKASTLAPVGSYHSLAAPQAKYMFDNDLETYYHSGQAQRTDDFLGVDMGIVREVREVRIIQGRNSEDDVDYFDHCVVEYSVDGEEWIALTEPLVGVYDVEWQGEPIEARYVGIRKLESEKRNWLAIREFAINPVTESEYGNDGNPFTLLQGLDTASFTVVEDARDGRCVALLGGVDGASYKAYSADGTVVEQGSITTPYFTIDSLANVATIEFSGVDKIFEVMFLD